MRKEDLFDTIENIDEKYIKMADTYKSKKRSYKWAGILSIAASLILVIGAVNNGPQLPNTEPVQQTTKVKENSSEDETSYADESQEGSMSNDVNDSIEEGFIEWNGKTISNQLYEMFKDGEDNITYTILARPYIDYEFEYEGKTLNDYYSDLCDERNLPDILMQLLKQGDSLKYGTLLYEGGAPNGEKWIKELYEERVKYFGEDILNKYIVDGQFLADEVSKDLEIAMSTHEAEEMHNKAFAAYYKYLAEELAGSLSIDIKSDNNGVILSVTENELKAFSAPKLRAWTFANAKASIGQDEDIAE